ncbi:MAG TPA: CBS domain-containing protein [Gemmatimonadaceae bacterium]
MTTDIASVSPETTVREAMELLAGRHVSGAPVIANGHLVGVVTATDLMMFAAALSGVPTQRDTDEPWSDGGASVMDDAERERECSSTFFAELWDDAGADSAERMETVESPEWNALEEHDVSEVMTRAPLVTLRPDADAVTAAALMSERGIHRVLVVENTQLVGIVSALDIANAAAKHLLTSRTYVAIPRHDFREESLTTWRYDH